VQQIFEILRVKFLAILKKFLHEQWSGCRPTGLLEFQFRCSKLLPCLDQNLMKIFIYSPIMAWVHVIAEQPLRVYSERFMTTVVVVSSRLTLLTNNETLAPSSVKRSWIDPDFRERSLTKRFVPARALSFLSYK